MVLPGPRTTLLASWGCALGYDRDQQIEIAYRMALPAPARPANPIPRPGSPYAPVARAKDARGTRLRHPARQVRVGWRGLARLLEDPDPNGPACASS